MPKKLIRKLHRWLGLLFSITILTSSGSGLIHILMSRTQSPPPPTRPGGDFLDAQAFVATPQEVLQNREVQSLSVRKIADRPYYQLLSGHGAKPTYVDATNGQEAPEADAHYARQIAEQFSPGSKATQTNYLTAFDREYIGIFRILPVYRFDLDDEKGTRLYVSTLTGSVTRHTDDRKQLEANLFSSLHKFSFIRDKDQRDLALGSVTLAAFLVSLLGIVLFFITRPRGKTKSPSSPPSP